MPAKIAAFVLAGLFFTMYVFLDLHLMQELRNANPDFIEKNGLPRWPGDTTGRPASTWIIVLFRKYVTIGDNRITRLGDLTLGLLMATVLSILGVLFLPGGLWLWK